jgi:O-antigen ligase
VAAALRCALLGAWILAFLTLLGAESVLVNPSLRIATQVLYAVPLVGWTLWRIRHGAALDWTDIAVVVALLASVAVTLTARDQTGALETLGLAACWALVFWTMRTVPQESAWRPRIAGMVAVSLTLSLVLNAGLLVAEKISWISRFRTLPPLEGRIVIPWETVNVMPVVVLLTVPFVAFMPAGLMRRGVVVLLVVAGAVVTIFSGGRTGYLALGVAALAFVALSSAYRAAIARRWPLGRRATIAVTGLVAVAGLAIVGGLILRGLGDSGRLLLWEQSVAMVADRPLTGHGPSAYSWARLMYGDESARLIAVRLTHNVPLQTLIDGGLVLGAAMVALVGAWTWRVARLLPTMTTGRRAALAALAGYATTLVLDDYSSVLSVTALVITLAAWVIGPVVASGVRDRSGWVAPAVAVVILVAAVPFVVRTDSARSAAADAREAAVAGDWDRAVAGFEQAAGSHPEIGGYWLELGLARASSGDEPGAASAYAMATQTSPGDPRAFGALAALERDPSRRLELLATADRLALTDPQYPFRYGETLRDGGDRILAWARAVRLESRLFRVLADQLPDAESLATAVDVLVAHHPRASTPPDDGVRWDIRLALGQLPADAGPAWRAVAQALSGHVHDATASAEIAIADAASETRGYRAAAFVAAVRCDAASAGAYADQAAELEDGPRVPVSITREFIYREDSLGASQPPSTPRMPQLEPWPVSLVGAPVCAESGS